MGPPRSDDAVCEAQVRCPGGLVRKWGMSLHLSTEALARASARRPWLVIGAWSLVLLASLGAIATLLSDALTTDMRPFHPEERRSLMVEQLLAKQRAVDSIPIARSRYFATSKPTRR